MHRARLLNVWEIRTSPLDFIVQSLNNLHTLLQITKAFNKVRPLLDVEGYYPPTAQS
jgi:hypothetical protein